MRLWVGLVLICGVAPMPDSKQLIGMGVSGKPEECRNEGEIMDTKNISATDCFTCVCKNGFIECVKVPCLTEQGCHRLMASAKGICCRKCKGCLYGGVMRESGTEWRDPNNPCKVLTCKAGVVTETQEQCYVPCHNPEPPMPGYCCPTCPGCEVNGKRVSAERNVRVGEDPCLGCQCLGERHLYCSKKACPVLQCPMSARYTRPGDCCPTCNGSRSLIEPPSGQCLHVSEIHAAGSSYSVDQCTSCQCHNGTTVCQRPSCPVLDCPLEYQITPARHCCPYCPPPAVQEIKTTCTYGGRTYKEGESWQLDQCKSCSCKRGQIKCAMETCSHNLPCPPNQKLTTLPGQCCPKCVENDRVCTVFGDPHYRTFDGKSFNFQGPCKYQLTADCVDHTFSIRVTNDARSTKTSSWTKTVSIKVRDMKVNLGERRRVKVNGVRVSVPHERPGLRVTEAQDGEVLVETELGLRVVWDGNSFVEVSVPASYKGKLCGLCGNYNSELKDDLRTRRGRLTNDPEKFAASWRVGGRRACSRQPDQPPAHCSSLLQPHKRFRDKRCKPLRSQVFSPCHKKLNYMVYFKACLKDMCECPSRKCYCDVFMAYAHECKRLGVSLPNWRNQTGCFPRH